MTIATRTDDDGVAFPSYKCLVEDAGMGQRSIRRTLEIIPRDELEIIPGGSIKGGKRTATTYRIIVPKSVNNADDRAPDAHGRGLTVRLVSPDRAPGAHLTVLTEEKKERATREDAGQAGYLSNLFSVTESESEKSPSSAPPPFQKNGASAPQSKAPRPKASAKVPCVPPSLEEFLAYCAAKEISEQDAKDQFEIWSENDWYDGLGNPIRKWKGKLVTFKKGANLPSDKRARRNGSVNHRQPAKKLTAFERWQQQQK